MIRLYGIDQFECLKASLGDFLTGTTSDGLSILTVLFIEFDFVWIIREEEFFFRVLTRLLERRLFSLPRG